LKNDDQIKKELVSDKSIDKPIRLVIYSHSNVDPANKRGAFIEAIDRIINEHGISTSIMLLGRTKYDLDFITKDNDEEEETTFSVSYSRKTESHRISYRIYPDLDMHFFTVHRAKGKEADNVIVLNGESGLLGFPNEIEDDEMLQLVLSEPDKFLFAEERRLFYVALTRIILKWIYYHLIVLKQCFLLPVINAPDVNQAI